MINKNNMVEQATPQQKKVPIQFYLTEDMKKRLKMYCVANDTNMKDVLVDILDNHHKLDQSRKINARSAVQIRK